MNARRSQARAPSCEGVSGELDDHASEVERGSEEGLTDSPVARGSPVPKRDLAHEP